MSPWGQKLGRHAAAASTDWQRSASAFHGRDRGTSARTFLFTVDRIQIACKSADEIGRRKAVLHDELNVESAALWVSDKVEILRFYRMMLDRLRPLLSDPGADDRTRSRFNRDAAKLLHDCPSEHS